MAKFEQHFEIEGRYYGKVERDFLWDRKSLGAKPMSDLYYCLACGEVWARLPVWYDGKLCQWQSHRTFCSKCENPWSASLCEPEGSIWRSWDTQFLKHLPQPVLEREFWLHMTKAGYGDDRSNGADNAARRGKCDADGASGVRQDTFHRNAG